METPRAVVAFQGEAGAYSEEAVFNRFGHPIRTKPCRTLPEVFALVNRKIVSHGVVPVENSLEGSVNQTYDLLLTSNVQVCGEIMLRVSHCLIGHPGAQLRNIRTVYSHPQALAQCQSFLASHKLKAVAEYDTAGSVELIKQRGSLTVAAIASRRAAQLHEMQVLAEGIEDQKSNFTRFLVLGSSDYQRTGRDKTSIIFSVKHEPGSLYRALRPLALRKINLTKIESRPTRTTPWEYNFFVDFEGHRSDQAVSEALAALEHTALFLKVLGSYPRSEDRRV